MYRTVIYLGPSLSVEIARRILDGHYLPPVQRGSLAKLSLDVKIVGIIDGEFYQSLAVSPKEILDLLDRGVAVYGASSMGALRAAELHPYGMIGVGKIFGMYRDGIIDADDEVAQIYIAHNYAPCSESLVDIRYGLERAVSRGVITQPAAAKLVDQLKGTYFPYRSYRMVEQLCPELKDLVQLRPSLKAEDAKLLLQILSQEITDRDSADMQQIA